MMQTLKINKTIFVGRYLRITETSFCDPAHAPELELELATNYDAESKFKSGAAYLASVYDEKAKRFKISERQVWLELFDGFEDVGIEVQKPITTGNGAEQCQLVVVVNCYRNATVEAEPTIPDEVKRKVRYQNARFYSDWRKETSALEMLRCLENIKLR